MVYSISIKRARGSAYYIHIKYLYLYSQVILGIIRGFIYVGMQYVVFQYCWLTAYYWTTFSAFQTGYKYNFSFLKLGKILKILEFICSRKTYHVQLEWIHKSYNNVFVRDVIAYIILSSEASSASLLFLISIWWFLHITWLVFLFLFSPHCKIGLNSVGSVKPACITFS